jgi:hypothetical protein
LAQSQSPAGASNSGGRGIFAASRSFFADSVGAVETIGDNITEKSRRNKIRFSRRTFAIARGGVKLDL